MPLRSGDSRAVISHNISELTHHGSRPRSHEQIVAIALSNARRHPRADGGSADVDRALHIARHLAGGGLADTEPRMPYFVRQEAREIDNNPYGFAAGIGGGRTDKNNVNVAAGSYVLPADVVSGLGDGNSLAGAHTWNQILTSMPWGITPPRSAGRRGPPNPPHDAALMQGLIDRQKEPITPGFARGGMGDNGGPPLEEPPEVPIASADGEITASPEDVLRVGQHYSPQRDLDNYPASHGRIMRRGHRVLDHFVKQVRGDTIRHMKKLKGPVGSHEASRGHV